MATTATPWRLRLVALSGPTLILFLTSLVFTAVRGQNRRSQPGMYDPSDPCLYGDSAACQLSCYQSHHSPGACLGYRCTCQPGLMYPTGPQRPPRDGRARYMSEEPREVPCMMGGDQRCSQFCVDNTGYGGQCQGMACKCFAMNGP